MSNEYTKVYSLTVQSDKRLIGNRAALIETFEYYQDKKSKALSIWDKYKKPIIILSGVIIVAAFVAAIALFICLPKSSADLKSHKNYSKFSKDICSLNYTTDFKNDTFSLKFPWLVRILRKNGTEDVHSCTAAIIANDLILTAAHCLDEEGELKVSSVLLSGPFGENFNTKIPRKDFELIQNEDFPEDRNESADIGLIKLSKPLNFSYAFYPICLPFDNPVLPHDLSLIQWQNQDINITNIEKTEVAELSSDACQEQYKSIDSEKNIQFHKDKDQAIFCVDYDAIRSSKGDSGTPAIKTNDDGSILYGILQSGGLKSKLPDLYVTLQSHLRWILDHA